MNKLKAVNAILQYNLIVLGITTIILNNVTVNMLKLFSICKAASAIKALIII